MAEVLSGPLWSQLTQASDEELALIRSALTVTQPNFRYTRAARMRGWDGSIRFLNRPSNKFLTGLTMRVALELRKHSLPVSVRLTYNPPRAPQPLCTALQGKAARDYQGEAAEGIVRRGRVAAQVGTGGGKTFIGSEVIRRLAQPTLWMCHTRDLLHQTRDEVQDMLGQHVGLVGDSRFEFPDTKVPVVVGLVQTLKSFGDNRFWQLWRSLFIDECQFASADTWYKCAMKCTNAVYRVGLSGTVYTGDPVRDMKLEGMTGPLWQVPGASEGELIDAGWLATPTIRMLQPSRSSFPTVDQVRDAVLPGWRDNPRRLRSKGGAMFAEMYQRGIVRNDERNELFLRAALHHLGKGEKVMLMCSKLEHGQRIFDRAPAEVKWWLSGKQNGTERKRAIAEFKRRDGAALMVVSRIFDAGIDIPQMDALGIMSGGESTNTTLQRVGRALRKRPGKDEVRIYDSLDGNDPKSRKDYLAQHSKQRVRDYKSKGYKVEWGLQ